MHNHAKVKRHNKSKLGCTLQSCLEQQSQLVAKSDARDRQCGTCPLQTDMKRLAHAT